MNCQNDSPTHPCERTIRHGIWVKRPKYQGVMGVSRAVCDWMKTWNPYLYFYLYCKWQYDYIWFQLVGCSCTHLRRHFATMKSHFGYHNLLKTFQWTLFRTMIHTMTQACWADMAADITYYMLWLHISVAWKGAQGRLEWLQMKTCVTFCNCLIESVSL